MASREYATDTEYRVKCEHLRLKTRYGLSAEEYSAMLARQRYACGICERPFVSTPHVDHCHITRWVRGLLCRSCNLGLGTFEDNPAFLFKAARYALRWHLHVLRVFNKEENNMMTNDDFGDSKASQMMRQAIVHELHQPFGVDEPPPVDKLQAVARALVTKAVAQDVSAIREILECINAKAPPNSTINDLSQLANLSWKLPESPSKMPPAKMSPPRENPLSESKSTAGRAPGSSSFANEPSASAAS